MKTIIAIIFFAASNIAFANSEKYATEIYEKTVLPRMEMMIDVMANSNMIEQKPLNQKIKVAIKSLLQNLLKTEKFRSTFISCHVKNYSEEELKILTDFINHPGFKLYTDKTVDVRVLGPAYSAFFDLIDESKKDFIKISRELDAQQSEGN